MMETNKELFEVLFGDGKVEEYKKKYEKKYGKIYPPFCLWEDDVEEYREKLRKAVED